MNNIAIIGASTNARVIYNFISDYKLFNVKCFAVDEEFRKTDSFCGLPVFTIQDLSKILKKEDCVFIGVQWNRLNKDRRILYERVKAMGFKFCNVIAPNAVIHGKVVLGDNIWIADNVIIETNCTIGSNTFIKSAALIGESSKIMNHCFIGAKSLIAGSCLINEQTFIGLGATVFDEVKVGKKCLVGARTIIKRDLNDFSVVISNTDNQIFKQFDSDSIETKLIASKNIR